MWERQRACEAIVLYGGSVCICVCVRACVCLCSLADEAKLILWWARGSLVKKKPAKSAFVLTGPLSDCHTHTVPRCLHILWLRCHLSQARCGWAGSCVCGCFALGPSSRIFIINEVTDYTFQISSCSMCRADVVALLLEWEWISVYSEFTKTFFSLSVYSYNTDTKLFISHNQTAHVLRARSFCFSSTRWVLIREFSCLWKRKRKHSYRREEKACVCASWTLSNSVRIHFQFHHCFGMCRVSIEKSLWVFWRLYTVYSLQFPLKH